MKQNLTQEELAALAQVSHRTIVSMEYGRLVKLDTLIRVCQHLKIPQSQVDQLVVKWLKLNLGPYSDRFWIDPKNNKTGPMVLNESHDSDAPVTKAVRKLPLRYQEEILKACSRPEVLKALVHLNEMHDKLSNKSQS